MKPSKVVFTSQMEEALSVYIETGAANVAAPAVPVLPAQPATVEPATASAASASSKESSSGGTRSLSDLAARVRAAAKK